MSTRVTQSMLNQNILFNLQRSNSAMAKYQEQLSTGKKITKPSDDPVVAVRSMYFRSSLNEIDQFKRNAEDGLSWMISTDEALDEVISVLHRVRELTVQGLNGTNGENERKAIAEEINQLKEHLGEIANTQMAGRYLFAGTDVKNPPYRMDDSGTEKVFLSKNEGKLELQVGPNNHVQINVPGVQVFNHDGNGGVFNVLKNIVTEFQSENSQSSDLLSELDQQLDHVLQIRADLGARMNRMELSTTRLEGLELSAVSMLSKEEDADITRVIIDLKAQENVHRAALSAGARMIQPSLVDFLR
ncbi:flagellar hook-associated protein FlgL [Neobacillus thermocopriae]|uniref:flagellar hook-associated protein FlgL n=1 Tax=Neobacillus thermocopriae TaxID=1215031 RepID=UPI002E1C969B|nr:flagellar hook-associated protein FlgL [Neobacillus thermocopriae]MED3713801.1 flagellar hook-associated protein FlgL [Neobacillus thermocopriae]